MTEDEGMGYAWARLTRAIEWAGARFIALERSGRDDLGFGEWRCHVGGPKGSNLYARQTGHSAYWAVQHAAVEVEKWPAIEEADRG